MTSHKILFVIGSFGCGGINRSLQNLLPLLKKRDDNLECDLLVLNPEGQYIEEFKDYNLYSVNKFTALCLSNLKSSKGLKKVWVFISKVFNKLSKGSLLKLFYRTCYKRIKKRDYDSIIAFSENVPSYFVSNFNHPNKIAWVHCDFASFMQFPNQDLKKENRVYASFNKIVNVSEYTNQSFNNIFPHYKYKSLAIHNVMDTEYMKKMALSPFVDSIFSDYTGFKIVTVGRIDHVKNQSIIPGIAFDLMKAGLDFKWYIIGPNSEPDEYQRLNEGIRKNNLEDYIILLGEKSNPYPYIAKSDLLVNTSSSEACPYVINEAKILGTPVLCREFGSATEFIENDMDGFIRNKEDFAETIEKLMITESSKLKEVKEKLKDFEYDNEGIIQKIITKIF